MSCAEAIPGGSLSGVRLAITDQNEELKHPVARGPGCPWQRCSVHLTRDTVMHCRRDQRGLIAAREVFQTENGPAAKQRVTNVLERLASAAPKVCELVEGAEDLTAFYAFPREHWNDQAAIRLHRRSAARTDEWRVQRRYLSAGSDLRICVLRGRVKPPAQRCLCGAFGSQEIREAIGEVIVSFSIPSAIRRSARPTARNT